MKKIWRSLTFNLSQALYPLIPDLYNIFYDLASNEYISAKQIRQLSQNIYLIISACMLFALGIKLISAIVNPDLLDDKKKGAKQTFFRCVTAVFLIVLIPMGFNKLYDLQAKVLEDQLIEKIVLGMDTSETSKPGQILAAYGFASFCEPNDTVSSESIADNYNRAMVEDINLIDNLDDAITSKTDGKWDLNYHPILSPAAGFFIVYEMIVVCMDIALRSIKLALLQLLAPIIICAYVIAGNDILQKWAKEVLSTFALLFLKIAMISFMIFGLSILPNFLKSIEETADGEGHGFFYKGIIRVFVIIGLFQLIKQLPDIINKIFGTNMKYRGGIRGRLGEMQGIGEMAQKAWDKIRTGAGAIATKGAIGMAALSSGPLGWGALAAAGAVNHGWKKGFGKDPTAWKDTKVGRGFRKFGAGAKAVGTGLTTKGGFIAGTKAAVKSYGESGITKDPGLIDSLQGRIKRDYKVGSDNRLSAVNAIDSIDSLDKFTAAQRKKLQEQFGITDFSRITRDKNGNLLSESEANKATSRRLSAYKDALKTIEAKNAENDVTLNRDKYLKGKMSRVSSEVEATENASRNKAIADSIKSKHGSLVSTFDDIASNTTDDTISKAVASLKSDFVTGQVSSQMAYQKLSELLGSSDGYVRKFKSDANKFEKLLMNDYVDDKGNVISDFGTMMKRNAITGGFVITDINDKVTDMDTVYNNTKGSLDQKMSAENFDETQKATVESLLSNAKVVYDSVASTSATFFDINESKTGTIAFGDGVILNDMVDYTAPSNIVINNNSNNSIINTNNNPNGYVQSDSGIFVPQNGQPSQSTTSVNNESGNVDKLEQEIKALNDRITELQQLGEKMSKEQQEELEDLQNDLSKRMDRLNNNE